MLVDLHTHLARDDDAVELSEAALTQRVAQAQARGVAEIAITEHTHRFIEVAGLFPDPFWNATAVTPIDSYIELVTSIGGIVRCGIELDWIPAINKDLQALIATRRFDVVLGSVHWLGIEAVDLKRGIWEHMDVETAWRRYFAELRAAALSGTFDIMAHPDLVKVFGRYPSAAVMQDEFRETAAAFAEAGVTSEINTAGLRKPVGELYPSPAFLNELRRAGVPLSLGSDAHVVSDIGRDFDRALELAAGAGYEAVSSFRQRERSEVPLG